MRSTGGSRGTFSISAILLLLTLAVASAIGEEGKASGPLDGKTFVVVTGEKGKQAKETDTLIFQDGKFRSTACDEFGFGEAPYAAAADGDAVKFTADAKSEKKGTIHWEGTVRGDKIDATYVWTDRAHWYKPNPKPVEKWAKGERKKSM
ncbi:MAG TPA: hypothetical protein VE080_00550 [Candidatus Aquicultoraceae bacterium]|nr:hypothetical protein [Candidatus Aquicultoraceae bacterium]